MDQDLHQVIEIIQKEYRRTRRVFGISIIILSLVLTILAPSIIRLDWPWQSQTLMTEPSLLTDDLPDTEATMIETEE